MKKLAWIFLFNCWAWALFAQSESTDKTLSPYFWVKSNKTDTDQLPLKHTSAQVNIAGVVADVKVTQVYTNEGKNPLEAIYIFPGSTRAAVYAMTMTIGERKLVAKIEKREKARQDYEQAKNEGKTASLLEQQNPNVFQMNVANILPGDKITVELRYTELLVPTEGIYEFAYPTVVGPRYSNQPAATANKNEKWVANPYLQSGEKPTYTFDIQSVINAGLPIQEVACTSHKVQVNYQDASTAQILLDNQEKFAGNKDYILKYRLAGNKVQSGLLLYEGENAVANADEQLIDNQEVEKFFLLMVQPPKKPTLDQIPPREYVFIVDISGSMHGFPLDISKKLLKNLIGNLRPSDRFNVLLFAGSNAVLAEQSLPATAENIDKAIAVIEQQRGGGSTEIIPALKAAFALKGTENFSRTFVAITDGYISVEREAFDLIRQNLNQANMFAFGIGSGVNRYLIEGMAHAGQGEPFILTKPEEAEAMGEKFRNYIQTPVLTNISLKYEGFSVYDVEPLSIPDVFAERPIIIYGKYRNTSPLGKITLTGLSGNQIYTQSIALADADTDNNQAIRYLWARKKIQLLDDYTKSFAYDSQNKKLAEEVTNLGLKYNLLTQYTSFIAIDPTVRNTQGTTTVQQPLPLPEGVSNYALPKTANTMSVRGFAPSRETRKAYPMYKDTQTKTANIESLSSLDKNKEDETLRGGSPNSKKEETGVEVKTDTSNLNKEKPKLEHLSQKHKTLRIEYEVEQGDYLHKIAKKYGVKEEQIRQWNNLQSDQLKIGQILVIEAEFVQEIHEVLEGESVYQIGILYGVKSADILKWNNLPNDKLSIGQPLIIYILAHRKHKK
ncbi:MAG: LysM peptidoglycan-binding domain-containing protein [Microscillaceae bacterium]|nr:LysM peptidoglycan-binding domain-containing protein [Microscillaceae bacterium]